MTELKQAVENIPAGEAEQIKTLVGMTTQALDNKYPAPKRKLRDVHPKSHGCVKAVFEVNTDIAKDLQIGLFANPGKTCDAWIRFSNATPVMGPDGSKGKHNSIGMALKIMEVGGSVLLDDNTANNQDFLMVTESVFPFANVTDYLRLLQGTLFKPSPNATDEDKQRAQRTLELMGIIAEKPVANVLEVQYFSAAPFLFGPDHVMKVSAIPSAGKKPQVVPENASEIHLREALIETMSQEEDICFDFMVQVRGKDEADLSIENVSTEWAEKDFPFIKVAKITIPALQTDIIKPDNVEHCEKLSYSPWHALVEHQPLGGINRLRKAVYLASQAHRGGRTEKTVGNLQGQASKMTHVADFLAISDTGERLRGGGSHKFDFSLPANADLDMDAVLALKVNASGSFERLTSTIEINGQQVFRIINNDESYQTLHEVIEHGILVPGVNEITVKVDDDERAGRGRVKFEDLVLWFKSQVATAAPVVPVTPVVAVAKPESKLEVAPGTVVDFLTLQDDSTDIGVNEHLDFTFELPTSVNVESSAVIFLSGSNITDEENMLEIFINGNDIRRGSYFTFYTSDWVSRHENIQSGALVAGTNTIRFRVSVVSEGSLKVSDIVLLFKHNVSVSKVVED